MRKTLVFAALASFALASCDVLRIDTPTTSSGTVVTPSASQTVKAGDQISVIYTGKKSDGSIFETNSKPGGTPLSFTVGAGQMIKGFDNGVLGMKLGEEKTIVISPENGYGPQSQQVPVPTEFFQEKPVEQTFPQKTFAEIISQDVSVSELPAGKSTVGSTIELPDGGVATVVALSGSTATVTFPNSASPFLGQKIVKGAKGAASVITLVEIIGIKGDQVMIRASNPFYGKTLKAGLIADMGRFGKVKIASLNSSGALLEIPNTHRLAGETLTFEVKVVEIK